MIEFVGMEEGNIVVDVWLGLEGFEGVKERSRGEGKVWGEVFSGEGGIVV